MNYTVHSIEGPMMVRLPKPPPGMNYVQAVNGWEWYDPFGRPSLPPMIPNTLQPKVPLITFPFPLTDKEWSYWITTQPSAQPIKHSFPFPSTEDEWDCWNEWMSSPPILTSQV